MQVILLEKVPNLGNLGETVKVKPGFGRNFLLPQNKALPASKANLEAFEARRAELEALAADKFDVAKGRADKLNEMRVTIAVMASDEGKLYGSVSSNEICEAVTKAGVEVDKNEVLLPNGVIREIGEFTIDIRVHSDIVAQITVEVVAEK